MTDEDCMREALELARQGAALGEVPVGAVVVMGGAIVGRGWNCPIGRHDPTAHAGATRYCTLEPCVMCAGGLVAARVERLVFATRDLRFGGVRSKFRIADSGALNHTVEIVEGVLAVECVELLREFFEARR